MIWEPLKLSLLVVSVAIVIIATLIDQRRNELQEEARVLGLRIYADKPRAFASRAEAYWRAWRDEIKHDPIRVG